MSENVCVVVGHYRECEGWWAIGTLVPFVLEEDCRIGRLRYHAGAYSYEVDLEVVSG